MKKSSIIHRFKRIKCLKSKEINRFSNSLELIRIRIMLTKSKAKWIYLSDRRLHRYTILVKIHSISTSNSRKNPPINKKNKPILSSDHPNPITMSIISKPVNKPNFQLLVKYNSIKTYHLIQRQDFKNKTHKQVPRKVWYKILYKDNNRD